MTRPACVLIVTGSLIGPRDPGALGLLRRQLAASRAAEGAWLDLQFKALFAERQLAQGLFLRTRRYRRSAYRGAVERLRHATSTLTPPELTEVVLATALRDEGVPFRVATFASLHGSRRERDALLAECDTVFLSATLLRDLSELEPMVALITRPHLRVVVGGALTGILHADWPGVPGVDLLTVGYGERLVPALAAWIRSGHQTLTPPEGGRIEHRGGTAILHSGSPPSRDLDHLPTPDWQLAERVHGQRFPLVHYESVRGCPYRCSFCNYPFLFDDTLFRRKSAAKIAADWIAYAAHGVKIVNCLDSLFTIPRDRLRDLCRRLIDADVPVRWVCYARADDLADLETCRLMQRAGCVQVQVGFESGNQGLLDAMNKRCTVELNQAALRNCREVGLTTFATLFIGFPGETEATVRETYGAFSAAPPDFYFVGPFTTRVEYLPILSPENRATYGIETSGLGRSSAPYWRHTTMSCTEVASWMRWFNRRVAQDRVALEGSLFYDRMLAFDPRDRDALLDYQHDLSQNHLVRRSFDLLTGWLQRRLERDVTRTLGAVAQ